MYLTMEERNSTEGETFEVRSEEGVMFGGVSVRRYPVPQDEEDYHYVKSFPPQGHEEEIIQFFKGYGFVVVRDVLSQPECRMTFSIIWRQM